MVELKRNNYRHPMILFAVGQVVTGWTEAEAQTICQKARPALEARFGPAKERKAVKVEFTVGSAQPNSVTHFAGLQFDFEPAGSRLVIEHERGIVVRLGHPYPGRSRLFSVMKDALQVIGAIAPSLQAKRVSVLLRNHINPDLDVIPIRDYVRPIADLDDPLLNTVVGFKHELIFDLSDLGPDLISKVFFENAAMHPGERGFWLTIDVLDGSATALADVEMRLKFVKDLESHVFETMITDKTRELFGIIKE